MKNCLPSLRNGGRFRHQEMINGVPNYSAEAMKKAAELPGWKKKLESFDTTGCNSPSGGLVPGVG